MKRFTNELGNEITVKVTKKGIDGVEGIFISIEGPTSLSENHITKKEAVVLLEMLGETLAP